MPAVYDELAGIDLDGYDDGIGAVRREDIRIPTIALNAKRTDANGRQIPADMLFHTIDETARESVNAVLLSRELTNSYAKYDNEEQRTHVLCRSDDLVTGTMADGKHRPCKGCPDALWITNPQTGKRGQNCSTVHNVLALDRDRQELFMIRFRKTSESPLVTHLNKYHIGKRKLPGGKLGNYPLYLLAVRISGRMASAKATYAVPVIELIGKLPPAEVVLCAETMQGYKDQMRGIIAAADAAEAQAGAGVRSDADDSAGGDTSFETDRFTDTAAEFVE